MSGESIPLSARILGDRSKSDDWIVGPLLNILGTTAWRSAVPVQPGLPQSVVRGRVGTAGADVMAGGRSNGVMAWTLVIDGALCGNMRGE